MKAGIIILILLSRGIAFGQEFDYDPDKAFMARNLVFDLAQIEKRLAQDEGKVKEMFRYTKSSWGHIWDMVIVSVEYDSITTIRIYWRYGAQSSSASGSFILNGDSDPSDRECIDSILKQFKTEEVWRETDPQESIDDGASQIIARRDVGVTRSRFRKTLGEDFKKGGIGEIDRWAMKFWESKSRKKAN